MKKNKMMRLASFLLVATLLTTSMISGTFAKYVTEGSASDSARVAKWGVEVEATDDTGFKKVYTSDTTDYAESTVISEEYVVAPGTEGDLADVVVKGTPEVAVEVSYEATLNLDGWELADNTEYCPIVFTVEEQEYKIGDAGITDMATLIEKVEAAIEGCKKTYPANQPIAYGEDAPTVSWAWDFDDEGKGTNDIKDTYLGNQAAKGNASTISLTVETTATQID